jgi:hypothetical protein
MGIKITFAWAVHIAQVNLSEIVNRKIYVDRSHIFGSRGIRYSKYAEAYDREPDVHVEG